MEERSQQNSPGSFGGKTFGTAGGGFFIYACVSLIENKAIKDIAIYAAPFVAVWCKEWGGIAAHSVKIWVIQLVQEFKLKDLKKKIDGLPDAPESEQIKKEVSVKYYQVSASIIAAGLDDVERLNKMIGEKERKVDDK